QVFGNPTNLVWQGDGSQDKWDVANSPNWLLAGGPSVFNQLDSVLFDDSGSANPSINLQGSLRPSTVTIASSTNYSISGSGKLGGNASLNQKGPGLLTISSANDYTGSTVVSGGTLKAGNANAFGSTNSTIIISNNSTLDVNGLSMGSRSIFVQGS